MFTTIFTEYNSKYFDLNLNNKIKTFFKEDFDNYVDTIISTKFIETKLVIDKIFENQLKQKEMELNVKLSNWSKSIDDYYKNKFNQFKDNIYKKARKCENDFEEILDKNFDEFVDNINNKYTKTIDDNNNKNIRFDDFMKKQKLKNKKK